MGICFMVVSAGAHYVGDCVGGTIITANSYANDKGGYCDVAQGNCNGETFCVSTDNDGLLNWWSAHLWCQANGGTLARFHNVCPGTNYANNNNRGTCANLTATMDPASQNSVWVLEASYVPNALKGSVSSANKAGRLKAICEN